MTASSEDIEAAASLVKMLQTPVSTWPRYVVEETPFTPQFGPSDHSPETVAALVARWKDELKRDDNDLALQIRRVRASLEGVRTGDLHFGWPDAPMRVAILLRKAGERVLEADFLEAFTERLPNGQGAVYRKLAERAVAARAALNKAH